MFCPNCATKNEEDVKFCRGCGQDISLVSRSLKGHTSIVLASKIDQIFDRPNEVLLRNGILWLLVGFGSLTISLWQLGRPDWLSVWFFSVGSWNLILYMHSVSIKSKKSETKLPATTLYCPACGESNQTETDFCRRCGKELGLVKELISNRRFGRFAHFLNKYFGWLACDINDSTWAKLSKGKPSSKYEVQASFFIGMVFLLYGLIDFLYLSKDPYYLIFLLIIVVSWLIIGLWDYIRAKRLGFEDNPTPTSTYNVFSDFRSDVIRILSRSKDKIIKVTILLLLLVEIVIGIIFGVDTAFNVLFVGIVLVLFSLVYLFSTTSSLATTFYFPGIGGLGELKENQRKEKKIIILVTQATIFIFVLLLGIIDFFVIKENFFSVLYPPIVISIVLLRLLQFLVFQMGLVEVVNENASPEEETAKLKTETQENQAEKSKKTEPQKVKILSLSDLKGWLMVLVFLLFVFVTFYATTSLLFWVSAIAVFLAILFAFLFLKIRLNQLYFSRPEEIQKQTSNETAALPTGKLSLPETLPLESPSMSVTEITTKPLEPTVKKVKKKRSMKNAIPHENI